jgi:hypothetical protein
LFSLFVQILYFMWDLNRWIDKNSSNEWMMWRFVFLRHSAFSQKWSIFKEKTVTSIFLFVCFLSIYLGKDYIGLCNIIAIYLWKSKAISKPSSVFKIQSILNCNFNKVGQKINCFFFVPVLIGLAFLFVCLFACLFNQFIRLFPPEREIFICFGAKTIHLLPHFMFELDIMLFKLKLLSWKSSFYLIHPMFPRILLTFQFRVHFIRKFYSVQSLFQIFFPLGKWCWNSRQCEKNLYQLVIVDIIHSPTK